MSGGGIGGAEASDAAPVKKERDQIVGLPLSTADEVLTVDGDFNSATVYAAVDGQTPGIVRVELAAELLGIRRQIASAFVVQGFTGPIITATGIATDGWHVSAAASSGSVRLKVGIAARRCCSAARVFVPPELLVFPAGALLEAPAAELNGVAGGTKPLIFPWGKEQGQYYNLSSAVEDGSADLLPGSRILHLRARASGANSFVRVFQPSGVTLAYVVPSMGAADMLLELHPEGALAARRIEWDNLDNLNVELVR